MSRSKKNRRINTRKTRKRGGESNEKKTPDELWGEVQKKYGPVKQQQKEEKIREFGKKRRLHFDKALSGMVKQTEAATADREAKKKKFTKFVTSKPERADVKPREWVVGNLILRKERSFDAEKKLIAKKQKKINKKFYQIYGKKLNAVITDETHPEYFQQRKKRILDILKKKIGEDKYNKFKKCDKKQTGQRNTGCSMQIYQTIEPNGEKRGKELLDAIAKHFNITPEDEKFKKIKGGKRKKRSARAGRKRGKKTKKKRHIITRKNKRKRIRRTKKKKRGGMPKHNRVEELRSKEKSVFRPLGERDKFKKPKISRSPSVRSSLNTAKMFQSKQQQTQAPQLVEMMGDLSVSSETQQ